MTYGHHSAPDLILAQLMVLRSSVWAVAPQFGLSSCQSERSPWTGRPFGTSSRPSPQTPTGYSKT